MITGFSRFFLCLELSHFCGSGSTTSRCGQATPRGASGLGSFLEFPPAVAEEDAFLLRIDAAQPQEIAERRCAAEACFAEKSTSLKARRARDFKSKGVLLHTFALVYLILLYTTQQQAKTKKKKG